MTLNTTIAIGKPANVRDVFDFCNTLLGAPSTVEWSQEDCDDSNRTGQRQILNAPMQGLPAWLWIYYGIDGPMRHSCDKWCAAEVGPAKWDETGERYHDAEEVAEHLAWIAANPTMNGWATVEVTFDTAYGYADENGERCNQLHARYIAQLGAWLDRRGIPWKWQNEYTGEWFDGYNGLAEFSSSRDATDWFDSVVRPVIEAQGGTVSS
jgi:hypothetical protein